MQINKETACMGLAGGLGCVGVGWGWAHQGWAQQARPRWDVGCGQRAAGAGGAQPAVAFNVTPARYGVSKPDWPTFLSCGCLACCRSKKKICCPAEDRFVIVNCQWRSSEGQPRATAAAGYWSAATGDRCSGQGTRKLGTS